MTLRLRSPKDRGGSDGGGILEEGAPLPPAWGLKSAVSWVINGYFSKFSDLFLFVTFFSKILGVFKHPKHPPSYGLESMHTSVQ